MRLPSALAKIVEDFSLCERQEKLELLLDYAGRLLPIPAGLTADFGQPEAVPECMTPVSVYLQVAEGRLRFYFDVPAEAPTVRGYASIIQHGLWDSTPADILNIPEDFYLATGLHDVLTPQRLNGLLAIMAHVKRLAVKNLIPQRSDALPE